MLRRLLAILALTTVALTTGGFTAATAHADKTYSGEGDQVVRIRATKTPGVIRFTHDGESNFIVHTIGQRGKVSEYLVNEIGSYDGTVLYNGDGSTSIAALEIKADGAWTATFKPVSGARCWCSGTIRGSGDQVLKLSPTRGLRTMSASYNGESNFIVHGHTRIGGYPNHLINEIGRYRGKVLLPTGTRLVTVNADGNWALTRR
ncbi:hypothetical protein SAMN05216276_1003298 [Streptosporangium subroseum]|uniref:Uncharacterized protein n=1 Tax=Streptosporangium subroseum TaxID=106412 RepID=A0A239BK48_9ACTN|nr:hypothetical protein [Streptosporangium subroseum]SNS08525.1 hypothetical protein SAMN05216276_1003298 [Streptosporangium subroseum]